jgi:D-serine deaminase-like pyridoxal phosphate-dependent protein
MASIPDSLSGADVAQAATEEARRAYAAMIGRHRSEVVTPALLLDLPAVRRNLERMAERLRGLSMDIRPHIKVHKSPQLSALQVQAGAIGVSTATVWEAVVLARAGIGGIAVMNTVAGPEKIAVLAALAREQELIVAIDDAGNAADLAAAARAAGSELGAVIEVDTGMDRAGVDSVREAVALARDVAALDGIRVAGVTGYEGHCSLTPEDDLRRTRQQEAMAFLVEAAESIRAEGIPCPIVSAGGTATWDWTAAYAGVTEIQAGSYLLMDRFHGPMAPDFQLALTVLSTVVSRRPDRAIVDAGNKSIGAPGLVTIRGHDLENLRFDEEHGVFVATPESAIALGDVVELIPGYAPATVNLFDVYHVLEDDRVLDIWPVIPRGPGYGPVIA